MAPIPCRRISSTRSERLWYLISSFTFVSHTIMAFFQYYKDIVLNKTLFNKIHHRIITGLH